MKIDQTQQNISQIQHTRIAPPNTREAHYSRSGKLLYGEKGKSALSRTEVTTPSPDRIMYNTLAGANASAHAVAQDIRSVDNTMRKIEHTVDKMDKALSMVVKSYPPYPVGSNERIAQMRQFSALRKMIDKLTIPPREDNSPVKILGDAAAFSSAGDWTVAPGPAKKELTIKSQPLHPGATGLDIPDLPVDASDKHIHDALAQLANAKTDIQRKRQAFVADANQVIASLL